MADELPDAPWALAAPKADLPDAPWVTKPESSLGDTAIDVAKSAPIGVVKGTIGMLGAPADFGSALGDARDKYLTNPILKAIGQPEIPLQGENPAMVLGSASLQKGLEAVTGPLYEPKTDAGKLAQTVGEFAPAVIGGPESLLAKAVTRVAVPAVASEAAGKITEGTAGEPLWRAAGAVAGSLLGHKLISPKIADAVPTADQIKAAAKAGYDHPEVAALQIAPASLDTAATNIVGDLNKTGYRALNAPQTYGLLQELRNPVNGVGTVADVDSVRKALNVVAGNFQNPAEQSAANRAIAGIDRYLTNLKQPDLLAGDAQRATDILQEARANWRSAKHSETMAGKLSDAELQSAATYSGGNLDNATRQKIKSILMNKRLSRGYSTDELEQMEGIVRGTTFGNISRKVGKLLGGGGGLAQAIVGGGGAAAAYETGDPRFLALPALGVAGRKLGERSTTKAAARLEQNIRASAPESQKWQQINNSINAQTLTPQVSPTATATYLSPYVREILRQQKDTQKLQP